MSQNSLNDTPSVKEDMFLHSQPTISLSQDIPAYLSQDMMDSQKIGRLLVATQLVPNDSAYMGYNSLLRSSQPNNFQFLSQEMLGSQQTYLCFSYIIV